MKYALTNYDTAASAIVEKLAGIFTKRFWQPYMELAQAFPSDHVLDFWSRFPQGKYPHLIANALEMAAIFASIYVREALFSKMENPKSRFTLNFFVCFWYALFYYRCFCYILVFFRCNQLLRTACSRFSHRFGKPIKSTIQNQGSL